MVKKGDTLIEVTLAVGIFSMIAISISAVMSSGTSSAQTALETTITRQEIDTQAEALRFIHSGYIADKDSNDERYKKLWQEITKNAVKVEDLGSAANRFIQFPPQTDLDQTNGKFTCSNLYNGVDSIVFNANARTFVINPRALGNFDAKSINKVYVAANKEKFFQASTYPRLVYGSSAQNDDQEGLVNNQFYDELYRAEGIYVMAVRDSGTNMIGEMGAEGTSAFYDFYIRTCWYGSNADEPSTISTVIRLYDPDAVKVVNKEN